MKGFEDVSSNFSSSFCTLTSQYLTKVLPKDSLSPKAYHRPLSNPNESSPPVDVLETPPKLRRMTTMSREFYIPYVILLGVLFGKGSRKERATKFFELVQIDLNPHVSNNDKDLPEYFLKMVELSTLFLVE